MGMYAYMHMCLIVINHMLIAPFHIELGHVPLIHCVYLAHVMASELAVEGKAGIDLQCTGQQHPAFMNLDCV